MSHFKVILIAMFSFWSSSSLMGMEDHNYLSQDIQKLMLFNNAGVEDKYGTLVPEDVKCIIVQDGYDIYCKQLFESKIYCPFLMRKLKFKDFWPSRLAMVNDEIRIKKFQGKEIKINDFDFIAMNNEKRNIFYRTLLTIPRLTEDGTFQYYYPADVITKLQLDHSDTEGKRFNPLSPDEYNKALKLPVALKHKIGLLCNVKTVGEEQVSSKKKWNDAKFWGILGGLAGTIGGGMLSGDYETLHALALAWEAGTNSSSWARHLAEQELKKIKPSAQALQTIKVIGLSGCTGAALGALVGFTTARDYDYNKVFSVIEKPLITLKEQEVIKKAEKEAQDKMAHAVFDGQHQIEVKKFEEQKKYMYTAAGKIRYMGKFSYQKLMKQPKQLKQD